jgi:hypothetical protein
MSIFLLQEAARETSELLARRPDPSALPLSGQMAYAYLGRLPGVVKAIARLVADGCAFEAITLRRPLIESTLKCAHILQMGETGKTPIDRPVGDREGIARDVWRRERLLDVKMLQEAAKFAPDRFTAAYLDTLGEARARFEAEIEGKKHTLDMAEDAGLEAEYRLGFGPTSLMCHGSVTAARMSVLELSPEQIADSLEHSAKAALSLLAVAAQLMNDQRAAARALELGARIAERPTAA